MIATVLFSKSSSDWLTKFIRNSIHRNSIRRTSIRKSDRFIQRRSRGLRYLLCAVLCLQIISFFGFVDKTAAAELQVLRIGTGGSSGNYFPVGSLIAQGINNHIAGDSLQNEHGRDVVLLAQRSNGSVSNVEDISSGLLESALVQADIAHLSYRGQDSVRSNMPKARLGAIASLYRESVHLVASRKSGINSIGDLSGKRVSIDEVGSGTELDVQIIFDALGMARERINIVYLKPDDAISRLQLDQLDAFFIVAGYPVQAVSELVDSGIANIVPISGEGIERILERDSFITRGEIPAGTYANTDSVETLAVSALWVAAWSMDEDVVYGLTKALWSDEVQALLMNGHPQGSQINLSSALLGLGIPVHPGAARFYQEAGIEVPSYRPITPEESAKVVK